MKEPITTRWVKILLIIFLAALILHHGRPFFVPLTFAGLFSMLLLPLSLKMEGWGVGRVGSILLSLLVFILFFGIVISLLAWQVGEMSQKGPEIEKNMTEKGQQLQQFIKETFGISVRKQDQMVKEQQQSSGSGQMGAMVTGFLGGLGTFLTNAILVLVYIFLFLYFRDHLKKFVMKLVPENQKANTGTIMANAWKVGLKYLTGLSIMIVCLWIMYGIGFMIVGVKQPVFFAVLCGLLEIVPFVGNLFGTGITILMSLAQGGDMNVILGIVITYALVQTIQTYLLEPLVVGKEVSINPLATIVGLVGGEFIWGIPGMVLAIPLMGIAKIICDHVEPLKPYGFLLGGNKESGGEGIGSKIKGLFKSKAS
jgi:predicted PurR-regulated permease PerM